MSIGPYHGGSAESYAPGSFWKVCMMMGGGPRQYVIELQNPIASNQDFRSLCGVFHAGEQDWWWTGDEAPVVTDVQEIKMDSRWRLVNIAGINDLFYFEDADCKLLVLRKYNADSFEGYLDSWGRQSFRQLEQLVQPPRRRD